MSDDTQLIWGTASSSTQTEGAAPAGTWARWEEQGRAPRSGEGNGFATNYPNDWAMLAEYGLRHHRLSIEWARIEPRAGRIDSDAVDHYREVLRSAAAAGISAWVTLHHYSLPGWFADDEHGFPDEHARTYFWARHVDRMGELFGDLVAGWIPVHDPLGYATAGWLTGEHPPGRTDPEAFSAALRGAHLANIEAWRLLRSGGRPVVTSIVGRPAYPAVRSREPDEREAATLRARALDDLVFGCLIRARRDGILALPGRAPEEIPDLAGAFDIVGLDYDHALAVYADGSTGPYPTDARPAATGHAPWPEGLAVSLRRIADALPGTPMHVTAAGLATPIDDPAQDEWRVDVIRAGGDEVARARADGIDVRAYFHGSAVDGYEWQHGFGIATGLFDRNRRPKASAAVARELAESSSPSEA